MNLGNIDNKEAFKIIGLVAIIIVMLVIIVLITVSPSDQTNNIVANVQNVANSVDTKNTINNTNTNTNSTNIANEETSASKTLKPEIVLKSVEDTAITVSVEGLNNLTSGVKEIQYAIEKWDLGEPKTYSVDKANQASQTYTFKDLKPETIYTIYVQIFDNNNNVYNLKKENVKTEKTI